MIAMLRYSSNNIGDDIQGLAMERLLPRVDLTIDRDDLSAARNWGPDVRFVLQGWFGSTMKVWPPVTKARILWVSVHCPEPEFVPPATQIGVRDPWSLSLCEARGIESWLSYCVSLTLTRPEIPRGDSVLLVDVPDGIRRQLPSRIAEGESITHLIKPDCDRSKEAITRLKKYAAAGWVITTRIHAFLPCVAMGTPVVFIPQPSSARRFPGYRHLAWSMANAPWENPRPCVQTEVIAGMMAPLKDALRRFIES